MQNLAILIIFSLGLGGCGISPFASRLTNPVLEDRVGLFDEGDVGIIATTADRRAIIFKDIKEQGSTTTKFCAEPPPDAVADVIRDLTAKFSAKFEAVDIGEAEFRDIRP